MKIERPFELKIMAKWVLAVCCALASGAAEIPKSSAELYGLTNIWSIHLKFTGDQWAAMQPKGGGGGFGPFGGGPGGPGPGPGPRPGGPGPGGFGGPGGPGRPGFGVGMFLAPAFMRDGDANGDSTLSHEEFQKLGEKWFNAWDTNHAGKVSADQLRAGLNTTLMPGGPGGGPGGPGQMSLQGPEGKRNGIASRAGIEYEYAHAEVDFEGKSFKDAAVRYKGNGTYLQSQGSDKRPMKVDFDKFVKGQQLASASKLNLHNSVTDAGYMNEALAYQLYRDAETPAPRTAFAKVNVTAPDKFSNQYIGLYCLVEEVDREFTHREFKVKGGALFKPVTPNLFQYLGEDWAKYKQTYDPKGGPSKEELARVIETCKFATQSSDEEFAAKLGNYIDLENFARYLAVTVWLSDLDGILGPGQNFYLFLHPETKKFSFIAWDQDHSFGQMRGSQEEREQLSVNKPWMNENRFLERVFKVAEFKKLYLARFAEFDKTVFKPERFQKQVDALAPVIRPAIREESEGKAERFEAAVRGETPSGGGFGFPGFGGAKPIKGFVAARAASIGDQLAGKSEGKVIGGFGFGPPGGGGGSRGGGPGGPPGGFGPGMFLGNVFMGELDANKDGQITASEAKEGFKKWFDTWNSDKSGQLDTEQLNAGINKDLSPFRGGFPGPGQP